MAGPQIAAVTPSAGNTAADRLTVPEADVVEAGGDASGVSSEGRLGGSGGGLAVESGSGSSLESGRPGCSSSGASGFDSGGRRGGSRVELGGLGSESDGGGGGGSAVSRVELGRRRSLEGKRARITAVMARSPAERSGLLPDDEIVTVNGETLRDVIRWHLLTDTAEVSIKVNRNGVVRQLHIVKNEGEPLGVEIESAVFDGVQTCDNHCEFCFIHQLPRGMRRSLYLKDDDYRLSFLYGNFTTLTRFNELDYERVITERLSPLYVSIHAADPEVRATILQNRRGAVSLRWLKLLLDAGIEVHGQVVVCPGVNDDHVLEDTFLGVLERFSELRTLCVVPLGLSKFNRQQRMRQHTLAEANQVLDLVHRWQELFLEALGRRLVFAADEYYLIGGREFPPAEHYYGIDMQEDGIGMARTFEREFFGSSNGTNDDAPSDTDLTASRNIPTPRSGFFAWVDGAPAAGYRAPRQLSDSPSALSPSTLSPSTLPPDTLPSSTLSPDTLSAHPSRQKTEVGVLTGALGAMVIQPLIASLGTDHIRVVEVENRFFGGNIGVTGLITGSDVARVLSDQPETHRYLLPDVCLSRGLFLDGMSPDDLPREIEIVATHGSALRRALGLG